MYTPTSWHLRLCTLIPDFVTFCCFLQSFAAFQNIKVFSLFLALQIISEAVSIGFRSSIPTLLFILSYQMNTVLFPLLWSQKVQRQQARRFLFNPLLNLLSASTGNELLQVLPTFKIGKLSSVVCKIINIFICTLV